MKTVLSVDVAKNKSMIMLMNSDGEILIDTKEIKHNLEDFEKAKEDKNIVESEEHTFGKYEGVYLRYHEVIQDGFFNQRIYLNTV